MKIIAGDFRGRQLRVPRGMTARPMRSQVREVLFQNLDDQLSGARVLDIFAGSGSLGFEAMSRGAAEGVFLDKAGVCLKALEGNAREFGIEERCRIIKCDLGRGLEAIRRDDREHIVDAVIDPFDVIVMDPPFPLLRKPPKRGEPDIRKLLHEIGQYNWLTENGRLAFEAPARCFRVESEIPSWGLKLIFRREYGTTSLWLLERA